MPSPRLFDGIPRLFRMSSNSHIGVLARLLLRFGKRDEGAAAVEFAIVAAPFIAMLFAILETALVFFAGQTLETAAADSASWPSRPAPM